MHFELPERLATSFREFLAHYLMIVVSILSALAAEQAVDYAYNVHKAHVFKAEIESELQRNIAMVDASMKENAATLKTWNSLLKRTHDLDVACGDAAEKQSRDILKDASGNYRADTPVLQSSAWESAIAVGSLANFELADIRRYSNAYSMQRYIASAMDVSLGGTIANMSDLAALPYEPQPNCVQLTRVVNARVRMLSVLERNLEELHAELVK